jgi:MFS family permease
MTYLGELRINWRYIAAATVGLASGYMLNHFINGIFAPHLLEEFGWSRAQYALIGLTILIGVVTMPIAGRLTDIYGVRPMATAGVLITPLLFLALSFQGGSFAYYFAINVLQLVLVGTTTTSMVYSRLIAERFRRARGLALSIGASAPAVAAAAFMPLLNSFIHDHGWRAGYVAVAIATAIGGALALLLLPRRRGEEALAAPIARRSVKEDYPEIFRSRAFQIIVAGKYFCCLTMMVQASQFKLVLGDKGIDSATAAGLLSVYAFAIAAGRFLSGLALDTFPSHIIAALVFALPGVGLFMIGTDLSDPTMLAIAIAIVGVSTGAELDVSAYLVMRFFRVEIYSSVYSLTQVIIAFAGTTGTLLLSLSLKLGGGFGVFYMGTGVIAILGGLIFLLLGRERPLTERPHS